MLHLWLCAPFLIYWFSAPSARVMLPSGAFAKLQVFIVIVCVYLLARTYLAFKDPAWLKWEFWFPPVDVAIISILVWLGDQNPLSNVTLLYFLPLAEAAGTLSIKWAAGVALWVFVSCALATNGFITDDPFAAWFRYFFIGVMGSLLTWVALANASIREQLGIARDRNRIALEMHDGVQGHLMTIASRLELAQRLNDPQRVTEIAGESRETARLAADELRFLVHRLRSPGLREGFLPALKQFAHLQCERNGLDLTFEVSGDAYDLGAAAENALFRIAQEALNNVLRHAKASKVDVCLSFNEEAVGLLVGDDGVGFCKGPDDGGHHAGLEGMHPRAEELGGSVVIESKVGGGTKVRVVIPKKAAVSEHV
jgi:signal transduction histidine kinase